MVCLNCVVTFVISNFEKLELEEVVVVVLALARVVVSPVCECERGG